MWNESNLFFSQEKNVLILDNTNIFHLEIKDLLSSTKLVLTCEKNVNSALEKISKQKFHFLICNLEMPGLNGFEFIKHVRNSENISYLPILAVSKCTNTESMSQAIRLGADAFCSIECIRHTLVLHIEALSRLQDAYEKSSKSLQLKTIQTLIGIHKHEFGNALAILDGKLRKLIKDHPSIKLDPSLESIQNSIVRIHCTIDKLNALRHLEAIENGKAKNIESESVK